ncbi:MAG: hypothetical protein E5W75_24225, partial [Mesorhizobium sp.]
FYAIPEGKRYALLPGKPLRTFPGIACLMTFVAEGSRTDRRERVPALSSAARVGSEPQCTLKCLRAEAFSPAWLRW